MNDDAEDGPSDAKRTPDALGVYQVVEAVILTIAFAIVYAFGIMHFAAAVAQLWGRGMAMMSAMFAVAVAVAFIDAASRILDQTRRKKKDDDEA